MTIEETREKILNDDEFVAEETKRVRYTYKLKKEIRYAQNRKNIMDTESVAEHIYGMHILAHYFLPLEDMSKELDLLKVFNMITWHDMEEIETGDHLSHVKTEKHLREAEEAIPLVLDNIPKHIKGSIGSLIYEYEDHNSPESKFVKAIDKIEPLFEVWGDDYKKIMHTNKNTLDSHFETKTQYIDKYPYIMRFFEINTKRLKDEGYFAASA